MKDFDTLINSSNDIAELRAEIDIFKKNVYTQRRKSIIESGEMTKRKAKAIKGLEMMGNIALVKKKAAETDFTKVAEFSYFAKINEQQLLVEKYKLVLPP